jgi:hypothetical protein
MGQYFVWWSRSYLESQKVHVDWMLVVFIVVRAEHTAWCLFAVEIRTEMCSPLSNIGELTFER